MLEIEHQAEHWDTADHGETGHLIAQAFREAIEIARAGGLKCEHRGERGQIRRHTEPRSPFRMAKRAKRLATTPATRAS
jgi:hypothetical protein